MEFVMPVAFRIYHFFSDDPRPNFPGNITDANFKLDRNRK